MTTSCLVLRRSDLLRRPEDVLKASVSARIYHFSQHKTLYFLAQTLHTFDKSRPIKVQIIRLLATCITFHQIPHVIFQTKSQFSSKCESFFGVMRGNSSVLF